MYVDVHYGRVLLWSPLTDEVELISLDLTDCVPSLDEITVLECATPLPNGDHGNQYNSMMLLWLHLYHQVLLTNQVF